MADFTADFEAGVNGAAITTAAGEGSATAWWVVHGTPTYDNTHTAHGSLAAKISGSDASHDLTWDGVTGGYGRFYIYATAWTTGLPNLVVHNGVWSFFTSSSGGFRVQDSVGNFVDSSITLALNQWVRFEWMVTYSTTAGQVVLKIFNDPDSTTPTETVTSPTTWNTGTGGSWLTYQCRSWGSDVWLDDLVANATTWPGPVQAPGVPDVLSMQAHVFGHGVW